MYPGRIATTTMLQLAAWETIAASWPLTPDPAPDSTDPVPCERCVYGTGLHRDHPHERCACGTGVIRTHDGQGAAYETTEAERLALVVAHLRAAHPRLDPN